MKDVRPMRLSRAMTCWDLEGETEPVPNATHLLRYVYQPLETYAPFDARPYCCYLNTVIFYEGRAWGSAAKEITRCEHYSLAAAPSPHLVYHDGKWWEISPDRVLWRNDRWYFRYTMDARTRHARLLNAGADALRAEARQSA